MTNTEKIREACIKANPENKKDQCLACGKDWNTPIRLADVLLAIDKSHKLPSGSYITAMDSLCFYEADTDRELFCWNLKEPMENQSEETKAFIAGVL